MSAFPKLFNKRRNRKGKLTFKNWTGFLKEKCLHKTANRKSLKRIKFCLNIYLKKQRFQ